VAVVGEWVPPLAAWLAAAALLCAAAAATGHDPFAASTWARFDSGNYESIARHGYDLHRCAPREGPSDHARWCGNTAWFPAYPLVLAVAGAIGLPLEPAGVAISWLAAAATLVLLWRWFLRRRVDALACAAFAPGVVYLYAVYPMSFFALSSVVFVRLLERRRSYAGLVGAVAALAYPIGMVLVPAVALVHASRAQGARARVTRSVLLAGPAVAAGLALLVAQRLQTGSWTAYFDVADNYGGLHEPAATWWTWLRVLWHSSGPFGYTLAPVWQLVLVTILLVAVVAVVATRLDLRDAALLLWCVGVWLVPLLQPGQSLWRSETALVLITPLLARLPRPLAWTAAVALAVVGFALAHGFFAGTLV
jgi:Gpi18-like mannosyltransferase